MRSTCILPKGSCRAAAACLATGWLQCMNPHLAQAYPCGQVAPYPPTQHSHSMVHLARQVPQLPPWTLCLLACNTQDSALLAHATVKNNDSACCSTLQAYVGSGYCMYVRHQYCRQVKAGEADISARERDSTAGLADTNHAS